MTGPDVSKGVLMRLLSLLFRLAWYARLRVPYGISLTMLLFNLRFRINIMVHVG